MAHALLAVVVCALGLFVALTVYHFTEVSAIHKICGAPSSASAFAHGTSDTDDELTRVVLRGNAFAIDTAGLDHTPVDADENAADRMFPGRVFGHQLGPCRSARALAIVHLAAAEAYAAAVHAAPVYLPAHTFAVAGGGGGGHAPSAVVEAVRVALSALYPSHAHRIAAQLAEPRAPAAARGRATGRAAALAVLANRSNDGAEQHAEIEYGSAEYHAAFPRAASPHDWTPDPTDTNALALGARWAARVRPFVLRSAAQFRPQPPPATASRAYAMAYDEAVALGGANVTVRDAERERVGVFWAYDGTPSLCAPPRLYNQLAQRLVHDAWYVRGAAYLRVLAALNVVLADAALAAWEAKYHYRVWRPVVGIRRGDEDDNAATVGDAYFVPLGAPKSNTRVRRGERLGFTPPFPAYPSGHAVFGAAAAQLLRHVHGGGADADTLPGGFAFVSDEFNGVTRDASGAVRPLAPRYYATLSQLEEENAQSRMYLGIHWCHDKTSGVRQGHQVADYVLTHWHVL